MRSIRLTKGIIDGFEYAGGWDVRWDDQVPGFGLRLYSSGKKSFVFSYRPKGRKHLAVLGRYGPLTVDQARRLARDAAHKVAQGIDPLEERRRDERRCTFGEFSAMFVDRHSRLRKKSWYEDQRRLERHVPKQWHRRPLDGITREDVARLHNKVGQERPYEANRLLSLLHILFEKALAWGYLDEACGNPATRIDRFREVARRRYATPIEVQRLAEAVDHQPNIFIRAFVWLLLLTGARKSELLSRRWADVDWEKRSLSLPETKHGEPQLIPLSDPALAILQAVPRLGDNEHIFVGAKPGRPLVNVDKAWRHIREQAGVADLRLHDLRRTVGSWMTQSGIDLNAVKSALRHRQIATTLIYARAGDDTPRQALDRMGELMVEAVGLRPQSAKASGDD